MPISHKAQGRLVRLIAGNPVTMGEMTLHVTDAGSYAPVTILMEEKPSGGTRVAYDTVASAIAPYTTRPLRRSPSGTCRVRRYR